MKKTTNTPAVSKLRPLKSGKEGKPIQEPRGGLAAEPATTDAGGTPLDPQAVKEHKAMLDKKLTDAKLDIQPVETKEFGDYKKLRVGDIIELEGTEHFVVMVNTFHARCVPTTVKVVDYTTTGGKQIKFNTLDRAKSISPNSEVKIIERLGADGLKKFLEEKQIKRGNAESGKKEPAPKPKSDPNKLTRFGKVLVDINGATPLPVEKLDLKYPAPKNLKKGADWPDEMIGDKIIHQMLVANKYTVAEICATVLETQKTHPDSEPWLLEEAYETIPLLKQWCKKAGIEASTVAG